MDLIAEYADRPMDQVGEQHRDSALLAVRAP
jgi:hypothetical protein